MNILLSQLSELRLQLENIFSPETAAPRSKINPPSSGHCAVVAKIVQDRFGGDLVSTYIKANSHWFNRIYIGDTYIDVDLTGDQFGLPPLNFSVSKPLYKPCIKRSNDDLCVETLRRYDILLDRLNSLETQHTYNL